MRFRPAAFSGVAVSLSAAGVLGWGSILLHAALLGEEGEAGRRSLAERALAAPVAVLERIDAMTHVDTFGRVSAARRAMLSSAVEGVVAEVAPTVREGRRLQAGEPILRLDPTEQQAALDAARAALAEAKAEATEAQQAVGAAEAALQTSRTRYELSRSIHARQQDLAARGIASGVALDEAALALLTAEQAITEREQAVVAARLRVERTARSVERMALAAEAAARRLADSRILAPFDGVVLGLDLVAGARVTANTPFATLMDPSELEVTFLVTDAEYGRLLRERVGPSGLAAEIYPQTGADPTHSGESPGPHLVGTVTHALPVVPDGGSGRALVARVDPAEDMDLRPGDFVGVRVAEPVLRDVARIPAVAATEDGVILVVGEDRRLQAVTARILRREAAHLIVDSVPFGREFVVARRPQFAPGVLVAPYVIEETEASPGAASRRGGDAPLRGDG